jgi:hypothetical protein
VDQVPDRLDPPYPDAARDLSRWLPLVMWLLAIPHYIVLCFLDVAALVAMIALADPSARGASLTRVRCRAPLNAVAFRVLQPGPECCFLLPVVPPGRLLGSGSAQSARFRASGRPAPALVTRTRVEDSCASFRRVISPRRADAGRLARKK